MIAHTIACVARDPNCDRCRAHPPVEPEHQCDDLCALTAEMLPMPAEHEALHKAEHCHQCGEHKGYPGHGDRLIRTHCRANRCTILTCPCGAEATTWGPLNCACGRNQVAGLRNPRLTALHRAYRAKRKGRW